MGAKKGQKRRLSDVKKEEDYDDEEDLSEYEKLRLKNIADRQSKFTELKVRSTCFKCILSIRGCTGPDRSEDPARFRK